MNAIEMKLVESGAMRKQIERNKMLVSMENCPKNNDMIPDPIDFAIVSILFECLVLGIFLAISCAMLEFTANFYDKRQKKSFPLIKENIT